MIIAESLLCLVLAGKPPMRSPGERFLFDSQSDSSEKVITVGDTVGSNNVLSLNMVADPIPATASSAISLQMQKLPFVNSVSVSQLGFLISAEIRVAQFDKASRRAVYAVEDQILAQFPNFVIEFFLIDVSQPELTGDAN